ncbi:unnamed protein product [Orchesella dallaii]|uniref:Uncharacterized protein n=1 Tax=Orchesella dallaii TaxID=48710 RepID=A0ABP1RHC4_9HEXA
MAGNGSPPRDSKLVKFCRIICPPNNASCTPLLKYAIQRLDWLNAHWYNSIYEFRTTSNSCLQLATWNTLRCKVFPLTAILTALIPMLSLVLEEYFYRTGKVTLVRMACYLVGSALGTALLSMFLILFIYPEAAPAFNSLYSLCDSQRTRVINNPNHRFPVDWNGILAIILVFGLAYPLPIFVFSLATVESLLAMGGSQFYVSPEAVLIIIGWDKLPLPLTGMFLMIFSLAVLVVFMYAKSAAKLGDTSRELIFSSIQNLRKSPRGKEWSLKLMSKVWSGKDRIKMYYGDGRSLEFQQHSPVEYLFVLLNNITNLLMLFAV